MYIECRNKGLECNFFALILNPKEIISLTTVSGYTVELTTTAAVITSPLLSPSREVLSGKICITSAALYRNIHRMPAGAVSADDGFTSVTERRVLRR